MTDFFLIDTNQSTTNTNVPVNNTIYIFTNSPRESVSEMVWCGNNSQSQVTGGDSGILVAGTSNPPEARGHEGCSRQTNQPGPCGAERETTQFIVGVLLTLFL